LIYTQQGERVTLDMTRDDYDKLMLMLGYATGAANMAGELTLFWSWLRLANELNNGNPNFRPYEIPEEFRRGGDLNPAGLADAATEVADE
jgi:hypothetical protein